jgi:hypothetical protein
MASVNVGFVPDNPERIEVKCGWKPPRNFSEHEKSSDGFALTLRRFLPIAVLKS